MGVKQKIRVDYEARDNLWSRFVNGLEDGIGFDKMRLEKH